MSVALNTHLQVNMSAQQPSKPVQRLHRDDGRICGDSFWTRNGPHNHLLFEIGARGREAVYEMLMGSLGCNIAWGAIDPSFIRSRLSC